MGAAFSGVSFRSIVNQVGPIADFAQPVGLAATATKSTLLSGESSLLRAALRWMMGRLLICPLRRWSGQVSIEEASFAKAKVYPKDKPPVRV